MYTKLVSIAILTSLSAPLMADRLRVVAELPKTVGISMVQDEAKKRINDTQADAFQSNDAYLNLFSFEGVAEQDIKTFRDELWVILKNGCERLGRSVLDGLSIKSDGRMLKNREVVLDVVVSPETQRLVELLSGHLADTFKLEHSSSWQPMITLGRIKKKTAVASDVLEGLYTPINKPFGIVRIYIIQETDKGSEKLWMFTISGSQATVYMSRVPGKMSGFIHYYKTPHAAKPRLVRRFLTPKQKMVLRTVKKKARRYLNAKTS